MAGTDQFKFPDELENETPTALADGGEADIEIEIVDDTPEQDRGRKPLDREVEDPTDDEIENYSAGVKKRIKDLTHARHDERRAKEALAREKQELERLAQHMMDENRRLKQYVDTGAQQYAATLQTAADQELEMARRTLKAAQESFDTDAIISAQEAVMDAKMKVNAAKNFKAPPLQAPRDDVQTQQSQPERVTADEKTLRWQAKNQWFGANGFEEVTSYALGLHQKLVNSGIDPRSDEYFEQIDARMKSTFPDMFGGNSDKPKSADAPRKPASVVAPASRSSGAKKIQLTPTQVALAKKYGLTPQQYAAEVAKLESQNG
jgi:hypothetical protein